eukprot:10990233-Prorocentrum_lima.AAC.1
MKKNGLVVEKQIKACFWRCRRSGQVARLLGGYSARLEDHNLCVDHNLRVVQWAAWIVLAPKMWASATSTRCCS